MKITSSFVLASLTLAATSPSVTAAPVFNADVGSPELGFGSPRIEQSNRGSSFYGLKQGTSK